MGRCLTIPLWVSSTSQPTNLAVPTLTRFSFPVQAMKKASNGDCSSRFKVFSHPHICREKLENNPQTPEETERK